jgi:AraC-like DNA-binding protein
MVLGKEVADVYMLYDTRAVHPLDRFDHYRDGAGAELAPFAVQGRPPGHLLAAMSVAQVGDFAIETMTWAADCEVKTRRTDRLIRAYDPECYRILLSVIGGNREEQAGNQVFFRARDLALYDLSRPQHSAHTAGPAGMCVVTLSFPRALVPMPPAMVRPLIGALIPRNLPGRSLIAQLLVELTDTTEQLGDPALTDVLHECTVGLIRQRLGQPNGITPRTRRTLHLARVRGIIRRHHGDPALDPDRIAHVAGISPRYLHTIFRGAEFTPMQLVKQLRLEARYRSLQDPAQAAMPVKDIIARHGYRRPDQFARDFKQLYGVSASQVRGPATSFQPGVAGERWAATSARSAGGAPRPDLSRRRATE